jgi:hypothetical protein
MTWFHFFRERYKASFSEIRKLCSNSGGSYRLAILRTWFHFLWARACSERPAISMQWVSTAVVLRAASISPIVGYILR